MGHNPQPDCSVEGKDCDNMYDGLFVLVAFWRERMKTIKRIFILELVSTDNTEATLKKKFH